jgi:hypothetical protein
MDSATTYSDPALLAYSDARSEYTRQLCQYIVPATFNFFMKLLDKARQEVGRDAHKTLYQFQTYLKEIPEWNMEKVSNEIHQLDVAIGCEYLDDLLTAVFIAHTKILTAIRVSSKKTANVQISVPKVERFLFKVVCEMSGLYWKNTFLFRDDVKNLDKQQNYRQAETMIVEGISMAIRALVPVKNILRECVVMNDKNQVEADADSDADEQMPAAAAAAADGNVDMSAHPVVKALLAPTERLSADAKQGPITVATDQQSAVAEREQQEQQEREQQEQQEREQQEQQEREQQEQQEQEQAPVVNIDEHVSFAEYDTVFDGDESNMIFDPKNKESPQTGLLEISSEPPMELDIADIEDDGAPATPLTADDFEELTA